MPRVTARLGASGGLDPLIRLLALHTRVACGLRVAMDGRDEGIGVYHPQLAKAEPGVDVGLGAKVVAQARVGDLDDEERRVGGQVLERDAARPEQEIRLVELVLSNAQRGLGDEVDGTADNTGEPVLLQRRLHDLVRDAPARHRHRLPADQLEPLVLENDALGHHRFDFGHAPPPPRKTLCGPRRGREVGRRCWFM